MCDSSDSRRCVAGYNQFAKLIRRGKVKKVYLANDADRQFATRVMSELESAQNVEVDTSLTSTQLAEKMGVEVPTAIVTEIF